MEVAGKKTVKMLDEISEIDFEESGNIDNPNSVINQVANQYNNNNCNENRERNFISSNKLGSISTGRNNENKETSICELHKRRVIIAKDVKDNPFRTGAFDKDFKKEKELEHKDSLSFSNMIDNRNIKNDQNKVDKNMHLHEEHFKGQSSNIKREKNIKSLKMLSSSKNNEDSDDYYNDNKQIIESAPRSLVERKISRFILQNGSYDYNKHLIHSNTRSHSEYHNKCYKNQNCIEKILDNSVLTNNLISGVHNNSNSNRLVYGAMENKRIRINPDIKHNKSNISRSFKVLPPICRNQELERDSKISRSEVI